MFLGLPTDSRFAEIQGQAAKYAALLLAANVEDIAESPTRNNKPMRVLKGIQVSPFDDTIINLIIRHDTEPFWKEVLRVADHHRVCAVGSPGIGKSITTAFLIKELLEKGKTVVYLKRTIRRDGWYCQCTPCPDGGVTTTLFPENLEPSDIPILIDPEAYYIVDPDKTKDSCDPSGFVKAKVIINASPDPGHWGGREFDKARDGKTGGEFRVYPLWSLEEMIAAAPLILADPHLDKVKENFRVFGGVARHVFAESPGALKTALDRQVEGVNSLTTEQAQRLAFGRIREVDTASSTQPRSSVLGYAMLDTSDKCTYEMADKRVDFISAKVKFDVVNKYLDDFFLALVTSDEDSALWKLLEEYLRIALVFKNSATTDAKSIGDRNGVNLKDGKFLLPGCNEMRLETEDIVEKARDHPEGRVIFHSTNKKYPLIDFIYKVGLTYYAVQVTKGDDHSSNVKHIQELIERLELKEGESVELVYAVAGLKLKKFVTKPANPKNSKELKEFKAITSKFDITAVAIPSRMK